MGTPRPRLTANVELRSCLVDANREVGVFDQGVTVHLSATLVRNTLPRAAGELCGDGVIVQASPAEPTLLVMTGAQVESSARVGLLAVAAEIALASRALVCNPIQLDVESLASLPYTLHDRGGNVCGRDDSAGPCQAVSVGLEPPDPLPLP